MTNIITFKGKNAISTLLFEALHTQLISQKNKHCFSDEFKRLNFVANRLFLHCD